ncbi:MAG: hypothetical protein AAF919_13405 [Pseudomonadota bacterium]
MDDNLCTSCNLCCDGTLFNSLALTSAEAARLNGDIIVRATPQGGQEMPQPCTRLGACGKCAIYEARPGKCRSYKCDLLKDVEAGEIDAGFARTVVARVKAMQAPCIAACRSVLPDGAWDDSISSAHEAIEFVVARGAADMEDPVFVEALFLWNVCMSYIRLRIQTRWRQPDEGKGVSRVHRGTEPSAAA